MSESDIFHEKAKLLKYIERAMFSNPTLEHYVRVHSVDRSNQEVDTFVLRGGIFEVHRYRKGLFVVVGRGGFVSVCIKKESRT